MNIKLFLKEKRLEWAGHVWWAFESLSRNVLVKNSPNERQRGKPRQRWLDRMKKDILEIFYDVHSDFAGTLKFF